MYCLVSSIHVFLTDNVMNKRFWPSVFGGPIAEDEQQLFSLPSRLGGMHGHFRSSRIAKNTSEDS